MLEGGVYPAAVTPMIADGSMDLTSVVRLLAYFEAAGCRGVVLAGTNGEGPSLSSFEKRDLMRVAVAHRGSLRLVLGIATPSFTEAQWLCAQAGKDGADAVLVMPPSYFKAATEGGVRDWFLRLADESPAPVLAYNFPKMTGFVMSPEFVAELSEHQNILGFKDSSGDAANLASYRQATKDKLLFVGDETLLPQALSEGWTGTISGAANCIPQWLSRFVADRNEASFEAVLPVIKAIRGASQPATNKAVLHALGVIETPTPRLPLLEADPAPVLSVMESRLGIASNRRLV